MHLSKYNIAVSGIETDKENLLRITVLQLNDIFGCNLHERGIHNSYIVGKKNTVIVEFVHISQKQISSNSYTS